MRVGDPAARHCLQKSPLPNGAGWNNTDVSAAFTATDALSGIDAGSSTVSPLLLTGEGTGFSDTATAVDLAGNSASLGSPAANIDKTAPTVTGSRAPLANANGWNGADVTVSFACTEALSGLAGGSPPADTLVTTEGLNQSVNGTCTDLAGNSNSGVVDNISIDKTAPTASVAATPGPNANGWNNTAVTVDIIARGCSW